jgi:protein-disulfide isomerase
MSAVKDDEQDLTRKQQRERAHVEPKALQRAQLNGAVLRDWLKRLGIVAGIVAGTIVLIVIASGCSSKQGALKPSGAQAQVTSAKRGTGAEVVALLAGIPQHGSTLGDPNAPVTVQFFADLQCPYCRRFTLEVLPSLIEGYVRPGKLKIEYRSLETATRDPETFKIQQVAALAAGEQHKMWEFIELFYREQGRENRGYVTERYLEELAQQLTGLDLIAWTAARNDAALANTITSDAQAAKNAGLTSTPTFLLSKSGATPYISKIVKLLRGYR